MSSLWKWQNWSTRCAFQSNNNVCACAITTSIYMGLGILFFFSSVSPSIFLYVFVFVMWLLMVMCLKRISARKRRTMKNAKSIFMSIDLHWIDVSTLLFVFYFQFIFVLMYARYFIPSLILRLYTLFHDLVDSLGFCSIPLFAFKSIYVIVAWNEEYSCFHFLDSIGEQKFKSTGGP